MKYLLDTLVLLWWWTDDQRLSAQARAAIGSERNQILVSAASAWEISTKHRIGKLPEGNLAVRQFNDLIEADGFVHLPVSSMHALRAGGFTFEHRDPFDRMLLAQSEIEHAALITIDPVLTMLGGRTYW